MRNNANVTIIKLFRIAPISRDQDWNEHRNKNCWIIHHVRTSLKRVSNNSLHNSNQVNTATAAVKTLTAYQFPLTIAPLHTTHILPLLDQNLFYKVPSFCFLNLFFFQFHQVAAEDVADNIFDHRFGLLFVSSHRLAGQLSARFKSINSHILYFISHCYNHFVSKLY